MRAVLLVALLLAAGVAGCSKTGLKVSADCPEIPRAEVVSARGLFNVDPRQPTDLLFVVKDLLAGTPVDLRANVTDNHGPGPGPHIEFEGKLAPMQRTDFPSNLGTQRLARLRINGTDYGTAASAVNWRVNYQVPLGCNGFAGGLGMGVAAFQKEGALLTPGQGAHVFYAGFWENGTLFETNIESFDHSAWPKAGWYQSEAYDPIPVYVYDQSRSEEPAYWKPVPGAPGTGTPIDGPVGTATSAPGIGYYSTIKGFNDGLKGLSTTSARVIHMNATDAYPAGTANNPLAGDNLVFYVYLEDVVDCPIPRPNGSQLAPCPAMP